MNTFLKRRGVQVQLFVLTILLTTVCNNKSLSQPASAQGGTAKPQVDMITDSEGNRYAIKKMPGNVWWMTTSLKINIPGSYCYDSLKENCETYGRLYTWEAAKKACILLGKGWHLPEQEDWRQLAINYGGAPEDSSDSRKKAYTALLTGGIAELNALLSGGRQVDGKYARLNAHGFYWMATETDSGNAWFANFGKGSLSLYLQKDGEKEHAFAVRCIKK